MSLLTPSKLPNPNAQKNNKQPVSPNDIKPVLQCLIHTILFHRTLGNVKPKEISCDVFPNISYMTCSDESVYSSLERSIIDVSKTSLSILGNSQKEATSTFVEVKFFERKKSEGWLSSMPIIGKGEVKLYWEIWKIKLDKPKHGKRPLSLSSLPYPTFSTPLHIDVDKSYLENQVRKAMFKIILQANEKIEHLPLLPSVNDLAKSPISFPYEIKNPQSKDSAQIPQSIGKIMGNLLKNPPVPTKT